MECQCHNQTNFCANHLFKKFRIATEKCGGAQSCINTWFVKNLKDPDRVDLANYFVETENIGDH